MLIITSAAYVTPGLAAEFGKLPPCMLPVQNKRLYEHQIALSKPKEPVVVSFPKSFELSSFDEIRLKSLNVRVVYVPDGFKLGQSIVYVLNSLALYNEPIRILHGDTLFSSILDEFDLCAVAEAEDNYDWASIGETSNDIYSGYFSFSNQSLLIRAVTESNYDFIAGVVAYGQQVSLKLSVLPNWLDFGILNSYYRSISKFTTQRCFNELEINCYSVIKSSNDKLKMAAEANWFQSLPPHMKHYAPAVWESGIKDGKGYYEIEYYYLSSLSNLFVFGRNTPYVWERIVDACAEYFEDEFLVKPADIKTVASQSNLLYSAKTLQRLEEYSKLSGISLDKEWEINGYHTPSLRQILEEFDPIISKDSTRFVSLMHGDTCFSNILYDFKSKTIKLIDPRGVDPNKNISIYGDIRYDVAKLSHSIVGLYDHIISGLYYYSEKSTYNVNLRFDIDDTAKKVQKYFIEHKYAGFDVVELCTYPITILLFLSMLPLHSDHSDRQKAMLANALRMYVEYHNFQKEIR